MQLELKIGPVSAAIWRKQIIMSLGPPDYDGRAA
jgi:hypothetical protein